MLCHQNFNNENNADVDVDDFHLKVFDDDAAIVMLQVVI